MLFAAPPGRLNGDDKRYGFLGGGAATTPFSEGLEAFCLGGPAFFGLRSSRLPRCWPLDMLVSFVVNDERLRTGLMQIEAGAALAGS